MTAVTFEDVLDQVEIDLESAGWSRLPDEELWVDPRTGCHHDAVTAMHIVLSRREPAVAWVI